MTLRNFAERARQIVAHTLFTEADPELDRTLIAGALVARDGDHYKIELGGESWTELEIQAQRLEGRCDCGCVLSRQDGRSRCRTCGREFTL